ncbi:hypothetical protein JCM16303_006030 [Sporobolomyces ruberrimus]
MRSAIVQILPFLLLLRAVAAVPAIWSQRDSHAAGSSFSSTPSSVFSEISFNSSTTTRAPAATITPSNDLTKRYYWGSSILQDPEPGDTSSQPPIGGENTTPNAQAGLTRPSFPPLAESTSTSVESDSLAPSQAPAPIPAGPTEDTASSSKLEISSADAESLVSVPAATPLAHHPTLAENRARRQKAWVSYSSKLAELSRLAAESKTSTSSAEAPKWSKIRAYRDIIPGQNRFHKVRRSSPR